MTEGRLRELALAHLSPGCCQELERILAGEYPIENAVEYFTDKISWAQESGDLTDERASEIFTALAE